jgi:uncharacterized membrane protein
MGTEVLPASVNARFCSYCGNPVPAGSSFCPACGAAVGGTTPPAGPQVNSPPLAAWGGLPSATFPQAYSATGAATPGSRDADRRALSAVNVAAILALLGAVAELVNLFPSSSASSFVTVPSNSSGTSLQVSASTLELIAATAFVGAVLAVLELIFFRRAFRALAPQDSRFSTPASLVLLALVAIMIAFLAGAGVFIILFQAVACAGSGNPITSTCFSAGAILGLLGLLAVGAILALVGYIGLLIGIWRLGARYNDDSFKAGAILLIFPVLNLVGLILVLLATKKARANLESGPYPTAFG